MVQMKIPAETKAMDRYLLAEYLQGEKKKITQITTIKLHTDALWCFPLAHVTLSRQGLRLLYLFFKMIIPMIMLAISDPCMETRQRVKHRDETEVEVMDLSDEQEKQTNSYSYWSEDHV